MRVPVAKIAIVERSCVAWLKAFLSLSGVGSRTCLVLPRRPVFVIERNGAFLLLRHRVGSWRPIGHILTLPVDELLFRSFLSLESGLIRGVLNHLDFLDVDKSILEHEKLVSRGFRNSRF